MKYIKTLTGSLSIVGVFNCERMSYTLSPFAFFASVGFKRASKSIASLCSACNFKAIDNLILEVKELIYAFCACDNFPFFTKKSIAAFAKSSHPWQPPSCDTPAPTNGTNRPWKAARRNDSGIVAISGSILLITQLN